MQALEARLVGNGEVTMLCYHVIRSLKYVEGIHNIILLEMLTQQRSSDTVEIPLMLIFLTLDSDALFFWIWHSTSCRDPQICIVELLTMLVQRSSVQIQTMH